MDALQNPIVKVMTRITLLYLKGKFNKLISGIMSIVALALIISLIFIEDPMLVQIISSALAWHYMFSTLGCFHSYMAVGLARDEFKNQGTADRHIRRYRVGEVLSLITSGLFLILSPLLMAIIVLAWFVVLRVVVLPDILVLAENLRK